MTESKLYGRTNELNDSKICGFTKVLEEKGEKYDHINVLKEKQIYGSTNNEGKVNQSFTKLNVMKENKVYLLVGCFKSKIYGRTNVLKEESKICQKLTFNL